MPRKFRFRLYKDIVLSDPGQPVFSAIGKIEEDRFLFLGQVEIYSKTDSALWLEISQLGKELACNRAKLDVLQRRRRISDPHLFGFLKILEETFAAAAWLCVDDEGDKYFRLTLLETKRPPNLEATLSKSSM